jgi:hypothetical protein
VNLQLSRAFESYIMVRQVQQTSDVRRFLLILPFHVSGEHHFNQLSWPWEYFGCDPQNSNDGFSFRLTRETELFREHVEYELNATATRLYESDGHLTCAPLERQDLR